MLAAIAIPNFVKARTTRSQMPASTTWQLDAAKQEWALEKAKKSTDTPTWTISSHILGKFPHCRPVAPTPLTQLVNHPSVAFPTTSCLKKSPY